MTNPPRLSSRQRANGRQSAERDRALGSPPAPRKAEQLALLLELSRAFSSLLDLDELLPMVNAKTKKVLDAESCAILLVDEAKGELYFPITSDLSPAIEERFRKIRVPPGQGIAGWVLKEGRSTIVPDVTRDERFYPDVDRQSGARTRDLLYAPLRTRHGVIGVIGLRNKRKGVFNDADLGFLDALAGPIAIAIDNARLYAGAKDSEERLRVQVGALRRDLARRDRFTEIVGTGPAMAEVFGLMESAAACSIAVLIQGETGTGKELVARGIHRESERSAGPFLAVNCAALPEPLLESELFGHRRGAFTGAIQDRRGLFEAASGGSIFLDEVGEMPPAMQAKLLRVLQEGEIVPLGDTRARAVDVRVISATHRDLSAEIAARRFRDDLYYRLSAFPIRLPALRERREDIPLLVARIITAAAERNRKRSNGVEPAALDRLMRYDWPGNVRELQNEIQRAVALARDKDSIGVEHLSSRLKAPAARADGAAKPIAPGATEIAAGAALRQARATVEARYIATVLEQHGGNITRAARALGVSRVTLHKKIREFNI